MTNELRHWLTLTERAYHGSPHKFDRFSLDHVGKGEGVQAYGYGLYFTSTRAVAEYYRDSIGYIQAVANKTWTAPKDIPKKTGEKIVAILSDFFGQFDPDYVITELRKEVRELPQLERYLKHLRERIKVLTNVRLRGAVPKVYDDLKKELDIHERMFKRAKIVVQVLPYLEKFGVEAFVAKGHVYSAEIPEEDEYLLWDRMLDQQPAPVKIALDKIDHPEVINHWRTNGAWDHVHGKTLYSVLSGGMTYGNVAGQKAASELLASLGIAGIKYLDANSRTGGAGTYHYVVFDDSRVSMINSE